MWFQLYETYNTSLSNSTSYVTYSRKLATIKIINKKLNWGHPVDFDTFPLNLLLNQCYKIPFNISIHIFLLVHFLWQEIIFILTVIHYPQTVKYGWLTLSILILPCGCELLSDGLSCNR